MCLSTLHNTYQNFKVLVNKLLYIPETKIKTINKTDNTKQVSTFKCIINKQI